MSVSGNRGYGDRIVHNWESLKHGVAEGSSATPSTSPPACCSRYRIAGASLLPGSSSVQPRPEGIADLDDGVSWRLGGYEIPTFRVRPQSC